MCVLPSVYEQDCVMAWQCVSIAILITVTPRTLPSLHVLYWTDRNRSRVTRRFVPACVMIVDTQKFHVCFFQARTRARVEAPKTAVPRTTASPTDFFPHLLFTDCVYLKYLRDPEHPRPRFSFLVESN